MLALQIKMFILLFIDLAMDSSICKVGQVSSNILALEALNSTYLPTKEVVKAHHFVVGTVEVQTVSEAL